MEPSCSAERNYGTREANGGRSGSSVNRNFESIAKDQQLHSVRISRTRIERLDAGAHRCFLELFTDVFRHSGGFRQQPNRPAYTRSQARVRIQVKFNSFGISAHGTPRGLRRRPPCNRGNNTNRRCTNVHCPFLCRSCSIFRTCSHTPACRTANTRLGRRASLSPKQTLPDRKALRQGAPEGRRNIFVMHCSFACPSDATRPARSALRTPIRPRPPRKSLLPERTPRKSDRCDPPEIQLALAR